MIIEKTLDQYFGMWKYCSDYFGEDMSDYWVIYTKTRDSSCLEISNYESIREYLDQHGVEYLEASFGHWVCGYFEQILIHKDIAANHVDIIWHIGRELEVYPIFDEDHYSDLEYNTIQEYWANESLSWRVEFIQNIGGNIFEARHPYCYGDTYDALRDWGW